MSKQLKKMYNSIVFSLGSCLVITGNGFPMTKKILHQSDAEALKNDWTVVGKDIKKATKTYGQFNERSEK